MKDRAERWLMRSFQTKKYAMMKFTSDATSKEMVGATQKLPQ